MTGLVDITDFAGIPVLLDSVTGELHLEEDVTSDPAIVRNLTALGDVLREPNVGGPNPVSYLYRAVRRDRDDQCLDNADLRYDLTVTVPGRVGQEYVKTTGHYHPKAEDGASFPEVYEVVHGTAAFVLQHVDDVAKLRPQVDRVWVQICTAGDRIVIAPDCGHVTVNVGTVPLVVADLVSRRCGHLYRSFKALRGAAYYILCHEGEVGGLRLVQNPAYTSLPVAEIERGSRCQPLLEPGRPLYDDFLTWPARYDFLNRSATTATRTIGLWLDPTS